LLSEGCRQCHKGAKMVLFVTGICTRSCWYCPISEERHGKDVVYANDHYVVIDEDIIKEVKLMNALGTGITGGEPLLVIDRVIRFCRLLKSEFGNKHHIHLYTGSAPTEENLKSLQGLVDEIRLHPPQEIWHEIMESDYIRAIRDAKELGFEVTIEVPSLPGLENLIPVLPFLDYLNINELEWSETNAEMMRNRGFDLEDNYHNAVKGAEIWAEELIKYDKVHWCSSTFKDSVQLRERLKRIAKNTARSFDEITDDGTIVYGILKPAGLLPEMDNNLYEEFDDHIEMAWWLLAENGDDFPGKKEVVERYPNGGMLVEVTPL